MTKKDYIKLAQIICDNADPNNTKNVVNQQGLVKDLIKWLQADNPNFDAGKFEDACYGIK